MKAIIVSDFAVLRSALLQLLGICLVIALFMGYVMGAVDTAAAIAAMIPFTGLFSLAAYDEQNNWERFRLTLPLTRRQVVFGRYASIALLTAGSLALALVLGLGIAALAGLLPAEWLPESLSPSENTPEMIVGSTVGGVSVVAIANVTGICAALTLRATLTGPATASSIRGHASSNPPSNPCAPIRAANPSAAHPPSCWSTPSSACAAPSTSPAPPAPSSEGTASRSSPTRSTRPPPRS